MTIKSSTLRPGLLVSLKTGTRGNVSYIKKDLDSATDAETGTAHVRWETERVITDPKEHDAAQKVRSKIRSLVSSCCISSDFGMLCPEVDAEKLDKAVVAARSLADDFNSTSKLSKIHVYVLTGRVSPDDVEAVRALNSEIRELMAEMATGVENGNVEAIREAASRVKGMGEMLAVDARTKAQMAVDTARAAAKAIVKDREKGAVEVDRSAIRRIQEMRTAFLDLDDVEEIAAPKASAPRQLDLAGE
jgi:hypothetical protein